MVEESSSVTNQGTDLKPHFVRITNGGKIKSWVEFSLKFFKENPGRPLVLHTLPSDVLQLLSIASLDLPHTGDSNPEDVMESGREQAAAGNVDGKSTHSTLHASPRNIPRLISVAEIIKREYFKMLTPGPESNGLYQYNYLGFAEDSAVASGLGSATENQREQEIAVALEGKRFLKQEKTPYMKITLCTTELPELEPQSTCQLPAMKKPSRSAKARQRRRLHKESKEKVDRT